MPYSWDTYNPLFVNHLKQINPSTILDIGPGAGTYSNLSKSILPNVKMTAVEATVDYINQFDLNSKYDKVINKTIQEFLLTENGTDYDLAICGDILEHLFLHEAISAIDSLLYTCKKVIVVWPTKLKQNNENAFENHKCNFFLQDLTRFNVLFYTKMQKIDQWLSREDDCWHHYVLLGK